MPKRPLFVLVIMLFLTGCSLEAAAFPTLIPLAATPAVIIPTQTATHPSAAPRPIDLPLPSATPLPPTPIGVGVRPDRAQQYWVPDAGPETPSSEEWRPPPLQPPISYHPDDHYWMIRPIPSGNRNYDLEWYPYGNDVLLPQLPPYRIHHGLDFPNDSGTPIMAVSSGTVVYTGTLPSPRNGINYYGNTVIIKHDWQWQGKNIYTLYAHTLELFVTVGDYVNQGDLIAGVGSSGEVSGPHLHLEVRVGNNTYGDTRNPALWVVPFEGYGTLAGRLVDRRGRFISSAAITVRPINVNTPVRSQRTYDLSVKSDEVWQENFVVGDLPAGEYLLLIYADGNTYRREVNIFPGQTTFEVISTLFEFSPTATPPPLESTPAATPEPTAASPNEDGR